MDVDKLAIDLLLKGMTKEQQNAALDSIKESVTQAKAIQKQRIGENVQVVVQALKKLEADIKARYDETGKAIEKRVSTIKDGKDGQNGINGKDGRDGRPGRDGATGARGNDGMPGRNGIDGVDGVSVTNAYIDFDGSLIINLSNGQDLNVGEVVAPDLAEKIKVITNGGGTSQQVIDTLISLQTQINDLIPSQTGNAGKFLTTDGTDVSWASVAGGLTFEGTWNASTNTPTLASGVGVNGEYYITDTAGSTNLDGITDWEIGDWLLFNGTVWQKIDQSNLVTSVNGQTGAVSLTTTNINEGTNLYYTDVRARGAISAGTGISYDSATGVVTNAAPDQTVSLTGAGTTSISGTYPNFTITSADSTVGTVTSVGGTGTVSGISLSGTVTSSGNLTLGGTLDLSSPPTIGATTAAAATVTTLTASADSAFTSTGSVTVSKGTTAERPGSPVSGMFRFNTSTNEFEGYNGTVFASVGGAALSNDTATATDLFPLFASATTGTASSLFTSNAQYLFKPSTGELSVRVPRASNGIVVNSATVSSSYTVATGNNALSTGPITINDGVTVTVSDGARYVVI